MRHAQSVRIGVVLALAGFAGASGCTHNHYYYGTAPPICDSQELHRTRFGEVCEMPTRVSGGSAVADAYDRASPSLTGDRPSRVVISEPGVGRGSRLAWRRRDPESTVTTRVEGAVSDESVTR